MYKVYVFVNTFLKPVHAGIQAAHAVAELFLNDEGGVSQWAQEHKTLIMLDGGVVAQMDAIENVTKSGYFSQGSFREPNMDMMLTAVAVLIPPRVWMTADALRRGELNKEQFMAEKEYTTFFENEQVHWGFSYDEYQMVMLLSELRLYV